MNSVFQNKSVLVTGGTGSFGKNFIKMLLEKTAPKKIVVFSRDEFKQYQMEKELNDGRLRFFIGDVRDLPRLQRAFNKIDIIVHAAALKQVPSIEYNPLEAVKTNIDGSQNVIDAAIDQKVKKVILVSTDKAAEPVNLYGATKLCAEKLFISGNFYSDANPVFSVVRYGNVVGSRGSIVENLLKNKTKKVQITHPDMTRFWITLEQSFDLIVFALKNMIGGEIFVPKIPSMKLIDIFDTIAPNAKKEIIGIRPGEKLHEALITKGEANRTVWQEKHFIILPETFPDLRSKNKYNKYYKLGKKLKNNFKFTSETNKEWLTKKDLEKAVKKISL